MAAKGKSSLHSSEFKSQTLNRGLRCSKPTPRDRKPFSAPQAASDRAAGVNEPDSTHIVRATHSSDMPHSCTTASLSRSASRSCDRRHHCRQQAVLPSPLPPPTLPHQNTSSLGLGPSQGASERARVPSSMKNPSISHEIPSSPRSWQCMERGDGCRRRSY